MWEQRDFGTGVSGDDGGFQCWMAMAIMLGIAVKVLQKLDPWRQPLYLRHRLYAAIESSVQN
jgi:hypothetical protein